VTGPYLLGVAASVLACGFVLELLRRGILREKFAALWLLVTTALLVVAVFPATLEWLADVIGVRVPANLLFFLGGVVLLLVSVQLSYEVSTLEARTRRLAEDLALLREEVRRSDEPDPH
jgi:hypothetical protein